MRFLEPAFFGEIGGGELLVIVVVILLVFGPGQLPDVARTLARALAGLRRAADEIKEEIGLDRDLGRDDRAARYVRKPQADQPQDKQGKGPQQGRLGRAADRIPSPPAGEGDPP